MCVHVCNVTFLFSSSDFFDLVEKTLFFPSDFFNLVEKIKKSTREAIFAQKFTFFLKLREKNQFFSK